MIDLKEKIHETAEKIMALDDTKNLGKIIDESNEIIDNLTREIGAENGIVFELPLMILLRSAKEKFLNDNFRVLFSEDNLAVIVNYLVTDLNSLFDSYPREIVIQAFKKDTFTAAAKPTLGECLHGGVELLERACDNLMKEKEKNK